MTDNSTEPAGVEVDYPEVFHVEVGSIDDIFADTISAAEAFESGKTETEGGRETVLTFTEFQGGCYGA